VDENALYTADGQRHEVDTIVCATGFDVSFKPRFPVIGRDGIDLRDQWSHCPRAYLSMFAANMPNYVTMLGPGSPSAQGSIIVSIERISDYVINMLDRLQTETIKTFEIQQSAVDELAEHTAAQLDLTVWTDNCSSWFKNGAKDGPVTALHPGGRLHFFAMLMKPVSSCVWL
jgi:cation diffusion facilitator CzcD-associated flavoprotein CzcO